MGSSNIARLGVVLAIDTAELSVEISEAKKKFKDFATEIERQSQAAAKEIIAMEYAIKDYGKSVSKVTLMERELAAGRFDKVTDTTRQMLLDRARALDALAASTKTVSNETFKMNQQQKIQMTYQTTDWFTQLASGQNMFIATIQQGGQLKDSMGGLGNMFKALWSVVTLFNVTLVAGVGAIAGYVYSIYSAEKSLNTFNKSMQMTGEFAAISHDKYISMSAAFANAANSSISNAREVMDALISSGTFTGVAFDKATSLILAYSKASGLSAKEAASTLIPALDGTASSAARLNQTHHFLTLAQYEQIEALNKHGKTQEAGILTMKLMQESLDAMKKPLTENASLWERIKTAASDFFTGLMTEDTDEQKIAKLKKITNPNFAFGGYGNSTWADAQRASAQQELDALEMKAREEKKFESLRASRAEQAAKEAQKIADRVAAGGFEKQKALASEHAKILAETKYQEELSGASEFEALKLKAAKDIIDNEREYANKSEAEKNHFGKQLDENKAAKKKQIETTLARDLKELEYKRFIETQVLMTKRAQEDEDEEQKLQDKRNAYLAKSFFAAEAEIVKANSMKEQAASATALLGLTEKEIALKKVDLDLSKALALIDINKDRQLPDAVGVARADAIRAAAAKRDAIEISEIFKQIDTTFNSVFGNMSTAIDNFVKTGKLSFSDFAASVIRDLIAIQMKAQASTLLGGLFRSIAPIFGGKDFGGALGNVGSKFADGGEPTPNRVSLVGENGPELFIPKTAGTIIPNGQMGSIGSTTNVTNNYINAIDTKSFEQRLLGSANAIWAANKYGEKNLAVGFGRT